MSKKVLDTTTRKIETVELSVSERAEIDAREAAHTADAPERASAAARVQAIVDLDALDAATIRPLRAILDAEKRGAAPAQADVDKLAELEAQAQAIRAGLSRL